jgi:uncharacterized protein (TIGR02265 family)
VTMTMPHDPVFGDRRLWLDNSPLRVKGTLISARPRYVRERWGEAALDDVASRVGPELRHLLYDELLSFRWYPMVDMVALDHAIIEGPMAGDATQMKAFGSEIARYDLPTVYRMLFRFGTPTFVVKRMNIAYATYIEGGRISVDTPGPGEAKLTLRDAVLPRFLCTHGIAGWITAALELSGAAEVMVEEVACRHDGDAHCQWHARWR